jgi:predicted MFS family arabinose efflux permease
MVIGPLIAGFAIDLAGHATACLYLVLQSVVTGSLVLRWGRTLPGGATRTAPASGALSNPFTDRELVKALGTSSLVQVGQDLYQFYIPVHGVAAGLSASAIGALLSTYAVASFVVRLAMPKLINRLGDERVLSYSFYLAAFGFILVPYFNSALALAAISFLFGLGIGCGQPITTMLIFSRSAEGRSGEIFGLRQTVNNALRVAAPPAFGLVATAFGLLPVFLLSAALMGGGGVLARPQSMPKERR